jgi:type I restriction enzyme S subunit
MDRSAFFRQFDKLADTPNAVIKMRELVLQLAVQGRLVPQEPSDIPASELLEQSAVVQKKLTAQTDIRHYVVRPINTEEQFLAQIPAGWVWARLHQLGHFCGGATPSMNNSSYWGDGIPWVTPKDMKTTWIRQSEMSVTKLALKETRLRLIPKQSILIVARSGILKRSLPAAMTDIECVVNQDIKVLVLFLPQLAPFVQLILRGHEEFILRTLVKGGMTVQSLKYQEFEAQPFPLPPLAEQKRIVAKVDELMLLCDELEKRQQARREVRTRLQQFALHHLVEAQEPQAFAAHWHCVRDNFHILHETPESISELRQTILQLAVRGRLVSQDPNDEPVSHLIRRIQAEKANLIATKKLPPEKQILKLKDNEIPFKVPDIWEWAVLDEVSLFTKGKAHEQIVDPHGRYVLVNARFVSTGGATKKFVRKILTPLSVGDLAIVMSDMPAGRALGRCFAIDKDNFYTLNQRIGAIRLLGQIEPEFAYIVLDRNEHFLSFNDGQKQTNLKKRQIVSCPFPLPPLAEQKRIVAKVDELLALCDELEHRLRQTEDHGSKLMDAIIAELLASERTIRASSQAHVSASLDPRKRNTNSSLIAALSE